MTLNAKLTESFLREKTKWLINKTAYLVLSTDETIDPTSTKGQLFGGEVLDTGYSRAEVTYSSGDISGASFSNGVLTLPDKLAEFTADGSSVSWRSLFFVLDGSDSAPKSFSNAGINTTTDRVTLASHGLTDGDEIVIALGTATSFPNNLAENTIYYAGVIDSSTFEIYSDSGLSNKIDLTNAPVGTYFLIYANGVVIAPFIESGLRTVSDGGRVPYPLRISEKS